MSNLPGAVKASALAFSRPFKSHRHVRAEVAKGARNSRRDRGKDSRLVGVSSGRTTSLNMSAITVEEADTIRPAQMRMAPPSRFGDKAFEWLTLAMASVVVVLVVLIGWELSVGSSLAIKKFGFHFLTTSTWDPVSEEFGALPFIYGTLVSSAIALIIAV